MLPVTPKSSRILLLIYLEIASIWTAPLKITQARPQIMKHTLQQPSPIETLQSLKAQKLHQDLQESTKLQHLMMTNLQQQMVTNTLQELAKIQAMQYANEIEMHPPDLMESWLPHMPMPFQPPSVPWHQQEEQSMIPVMPMLQQMSEDAVQEIALQQQMLALQQMQAFNQLNAHSPYTFPQSEPVLILLPDENTENTATKLYKLTNENDTKDHTNAGQDNNDEEKDAITIEADEAQPEHSEPPKGTRKAIILIPNARISIGGIISQIPWLPIEVNVPDTAIWAWNGIYNGISSIISIIGSRLPWRPRPENAVTEPSVKLFLKQIQRNDNGQMPLYPMPLDALIPVHFN